MAARRKANQQSRVVEIGASDVSISPDGSTTNLIVTLTDPSNEDLDAILEGNDNGSRDIESVTADLLCHPDLDPAALAYELAESYGVNEVIADLDHSSMLDEIPTDIILDYIKERMNE